MLQYLGWAVNSALFVLCCFLTASISNALFAAALTPDPADLSEEAESPPPPDRRSWSDRQAILARNLFNSGSEVVEPSPPPIESEELEATKLPLTLLGTAAATDDFYSWAAIEDRGSKKTKIVRVGDEVLPTVTLTRIERRRVVLDENGLPRELVLKEDGSKEKVASATSRDSRSSNKSSPRQRRRAASSRRPPAPSPLRQVAEGRFEIPRPELEAKLQDPSSLLNQARFMPKFEEGEMVGLQINDPRPGSLFQQAGIENGDVITEVNGERIDSAEQSSDFLSTLEESDEIEIVVRKADGSTETKTFSMPQL